MAIAQRHHPYYRPHSSSARLRSPYSRAVGYPLEEARPHRPIALPVPRGREAHEGFSIPRHISVPLLIAVALGLVAFVYAYSRLTDLGFKRVALGRQIHALEAQRNKLNELNTALADPERVRQWALASGMGPAGQASVNLYPRLALGAAPSGRVSGAGNSRHGAQPLLLASADREGR